MALSKQSILSHAGAFKAREVHVPAWKDPSGDDVVLVRGMTIKEFEVNQARAAEGESTAAVMVRCILDANGGRVFDDADTGLVSQLPLKDSLEISKAIMEESGLGDKVDEEAITVAVADAEGKSPETAGSEPS